MNSNLKSSLVLAGLVMAVSMTRPAVAKTAPTATGSVADGSPCKVDADCASGHCDVTDPSKPVCGPAPATKLANGATCTKDDECESGYCDGATTKVCTEQKALDEACSRNEGCISGYCPKGKCVACVADGDCADPGSKCQSNKCVVPPASIKDGDPCMDDSHCVNGTCADPTSVGAKTCQPKKAAPQPQPTKPTIPNCPPGTVATEFPAASGTFVCVTTQAPQPTAPVPTPAPALAPAPISLETVCGSFPLSDPTSSDSFDRIAGCVWMATAQACGTSRTQFWGDCAIRAQELAKGKTGLARVQSFFKNGLALVIEKYGNRLSGRFMDASALAALTGNLSAFAAALKGTASQGDLLRLALGTVTAGSRSSARRAPAASPRCEAGWTLLATTRNATFGSASGAWICHRSGVEGPGSWAEPSYGPAPVAPVPAPVTAPIPPSTSSR